MKMWIRKVIARENSHVTRTFRFPRWLEREVAKAFGTFGFHEYSSYFWNLACAQKKETAPHAHLSISPAIVDQIRQQSRHDPRVLATGDQALPLLFRARRAPMKERFGIDTAGLFEAGTLRVEVVFIVPDLKNSIRGQYLEAVGTGLTAAGARSVWTIVTEQTGMTATRERLSLPRSVDTRTVFWRDLCPGDHGSDPRLLANYLHALGPAIVIVCGSRLGARTLARYGPALKHLHLLYCAYVLNGERSLHAQSDLVHINEVAPCARLLTDAKENLPFLDGYLVRRPGTDVQVLAQSECSDKTRIRDVFGCDFSDRRPEVDAAVIVALMSSGVGCPPKERVFENKLPARTATVPAFDVTVAIVFHREGDLVVATLASLADMVEVARRAGIRVETLAVMDKPDEQTRSLVRVHGRDLDGIFEFNFGDAGLARNAAAKQARGAFTSILDGDDLWGAQWLRLAYLAATSSDACQNAIWHPNNVYSFSEIDWYRTPTDDIPGTRTKSAHFILQSSSESWFDARDLLLECLWICNAFARTEVFIQNPFRAADWERRWGIEDWAWHIETLGNGIPHLIVPDTVLIYREKESNSLDVATFARGMMPVLH